jgi:endonuclease/exonuclease/phosphatase (EEP) superfamily protein YafD
LGDTDAVVYLPMSESRAFRFVHRCGLALVTFSAALWLLTTICFFGVWDQVAAITTFPQWSWAIIGILTAAVAWRLLRPRTRIPFLLFGLWLLATLCFADNLLPVIRGIVHGSTPSSRAPQGTFRVVTLNCASSTSAAEETVRFQPDIVLLQESPTSNKVAELAREWFGDSASFVAGFDCAIISRYSLQTIDKRPAIHSTRAILILPEKRGLLVTSLRLTPSLGRTDLWNPAAWHAYTEDRRLRRRELRAVLEAELAQTELPEIVGGDFNAPAGDAIYKLLHNYRDSHRTAGRGWGNTALNTIPAFRPDQIWLKRLSAVSSHGVRTVHSDHRMVVTDVLLDPNEQ